MNKEKLLKQIVEEFGIEYQLAEAIFENIFEDVAPAFRGKEKEKDNGKT